MQDHQLACWHIAPGCRNEPRTYLRNELIE